MQLVNVSNPGRQFSVSFASCVLQNDLPPVLLRAKGVIGLDGQHCETHCM